MKRSAVPPWKAREVMAPALCSDSRMRACNTRAPDCRAERPGVRSGRFRRVFPSRRQFLVQMVQPAGGAPELRASGSLGESVQTVEIQPFGGVQPESAQEGRCVRPRPQVDEVQQRLLRMSYERLLLRGHLHRLVAPEQLSLHMTKTKCAQRGVVATRAAGGDAGGYRHVLGNDSVVRQGGLQAHIGSLYQAVGYQEGVGSHLGEGRSRGVETAGEPVDLTSLYPPGKLSLYGGRIHVSGQEQAALKDRLVSGEADQLFKIHIRILPYLTS